MKRLHSILLSITPLCLSGGSGKASTPISKKSNATTSAYHRISPEQAKKIMDEQENVILLDVRTYAEFTQNRIENSILIPDNELESRAEYELLDQNATILIYCRSGVRSQSAAYTLLAMGYSNVYDFGGILSYPYATITD